MSDQRRTRWDERYRVGDWTRDEAPTAIVEEARDRWLLDPGRALDVACGSGRNALHLARRGWAVLAVDMSVEGLRLLRDGARDGRCRVQPVLADLHRFHVRSGAFQLVVNTRFLLREAFPLLRDALAPGGLLVFETFSVDELEVLGGDIRRDFVLDHGELPKAFAEMEILFYEEGVFERPEGERGLARMIARKPA